MARGAKTAAVEAGPVEGLWELPEGWRWERLSSVTADYFSGRRPKGGVSDGTLGPLSLGAEHLGWNGKLKLATPKRIPAAFAETIGACQIGEGDILIVKDGATTGKCVFVEHLSEDAYINEHVFALRPTCEMDRRLLFYWLWSKSGFDLIMRDFRGAAQGGIGRTFVDQVVVPVPPLATQSAIVAQIDDLFADIDDGEYGLAAAKSAASTYRQTLLNAAVKGDLTADWRAINAPSDGSTVLLSTILQKRRSQAGGAGKAYKEPSEATPPEGRSLPPSWCWASVRQLMGTIRNGTSAKPTEDPRGPAVLRISAVRPMSVDLSSARRMPASFDSTGFLVEPGDLLVTRYNGSSALVGVCGRHRGTLFRSAGSSTSAAL